MGKAKRKGLGEKSDTSSAYNKFSSEYSSSSSSQQSSTEQPILLTANTGFQVASQVSTQENAPSEPELPSGVEKPGPRPAVPIESLEYRQWYEKWYAYSQATGDMSYEELQTTDTSSKPFHESANSQNAYGGWSQASQQVYPGDSSARDSTSQSAAYANYYTEYETTHPSTESSQSDANKIFETSSTDDFMSSQVDNPEKQPIQGDSRLSSGDHYTANTKQNVQQQLSWDQVDNQQGKPFQSVNMSAGDGPDIDSLDMSRAPPSFDSRQNQDNTNPPKHPSRSSADDMSDMQPEALPLNGRPSVEADANRVRQVNPNVRPAGPMFPGSRPARERFRAPFPYDPRFRTRGPFDPNFRPPRFPDPRFRGPMPTRPNHDFRAPRPDHNIRPPRHFDPNVRAPRPSDPNVRGPRPSDPNVRGPRPSGPNSRAPRPSDPNIRGPRPSDPNIRGPRPSDPNIRPPRALDPNLRPLRHADPNIRVPGPYGQNFGAQRPPNRVPRPSDSNFRPPLLSDSNKPPGSMNLAREAPRLPDSHLRPPGPSNFNVRNAAPRSQMANDGHFQAPKAADFNLRNTGPQYPRFRAMKPPDSRFRPQEPSDPNFQAPGSSLALGSSGPAESKFRGPQPLDPNLSGANLPNPEFRLPPSSGSNFHVPMSSGLDFQASVSSDSGKANFTVGKAHSTESKPGDSVHEDPRAGNANFGVSSSDTAGMPFRTDRFPGSDQTPLISSSGYPVVSADSSIEHETSVQQDATRENRMSQFGPLSRGELMNDRNQGVSRKDVGKLSMMDEALLQIKDLPQNSVIANILGDSGTFDQSAMNRLIDAGMQNNPTIVQGLVSKMASGAMDPQQMPEVVNQILSAALGSQVLTGQRKGEQLANSSHFQSARRQSFGSQLADVGSDQFPQQSTKNPGADGKSMGMDFQQPMGNRVQIDQMHPPSRSNPDGSSFVQKERHENRWPERGGNGPGFPVRSSTSHTMPQYHPTSSGVQFRQQSNHKNESWQGQEGPPRNEVTRMTPSQHSSNEPAQSCQPASQTIVAEKSSLLFCDQLKKARRSGLDVTQMLIWCEVCDDVWGEKAHPISEYVTHHVNSQDHCMALIPWMEVHPNKRYQDMLNIPPSNTRSDAKKNATLKEKLKCSFFCEVCEVVAGYSKKVYSKHLKTESHINKMIAIVNTVCPPPNPMQKPEELKDAQYLLIPQRLPKLTRDKNRFKTFPCQICAVAANDVGELTFSNWIPHMSTLFHMSILYDWLARCKASAAIPYQKVMNFKGQLADKKLPHFFCEICVKKVPHEDQLIEKHLKSSKHVKKVKELGEAVELALSGGPVTRILEEVNDGLDDVYHDDIDKIWHHPHTDAKSQALAKKKLEKQIEQTRLAIETEEQQRVQQQQPFGSAGQPEGFAPNSGQGPINALNSQQMMPMSNNMGQMAGTQMMQQNLMQDETNCHGNKNIANHAGIHPPIANHQRNPNQHNEESPPKTSAKGMLPMVQNDRLSSFIDEVSNANLQKVIAEISQSGGRLAKSLGPSQQPLSHTTATKKTVGGKGSKPLPRQSRNSGRFHSAEEHKMSSQHLKRKRTPYLGNEPRRSSLATNHVGNRRQSPDSRAHFHDQQPPTKQMKLQPTSSGVQSKPPKLSVDSNSQPINGQTGGKPMNTQKKVDPKQRQSLMKSTPETVESVDLSSLNMRVVDSKRGSVPEDERQSVQQKSSPTGKGHADKDEPLVERKPGNPNPSKALLPNPQRMALLPTPSTSHNTTPGRVDSLGVKKHPNVHRSRNPEAYRLLPEQIMFFAKLPAFPKDEAYCEICPEVSPFVDVAEWIEHVSTIAHMRALYEVAHSTRGPLTRHLYEKMVIPSCNLQNNYCICEMCELVNGESNMRSHLNSINHSSAVKNLAKNMKESGGWLADLMKDCKREFWNMQSSKSGELSKQASGETSSHGSNCQPIKYDSDTGSSTSYLFDFQHAHMSFLHSVLTGVVALTSFKRRKAAHGE